MQARASNHTLPSTFEERGASVPFTTPALAQSRVRKDYRDRLEIVIGEFYGGAGTYVIPWTAVAETISLTTHDVLLHEEVMNRKALDPYAVRIAALEVAKGGLAGPEVAAAATKTLADDEEAKALNQVVLILKVIEEAEPQQAKELMRNITNPDGQERVREALFSIGDRLNLDTKSFDQRLSELGIATYAVGTAWSPLEGRLRQLTGRLAEFSSSVAAWGSERLGESAEQAEFAAEVSAHTVTIAVESLQKFDMAVHSPRAIVADWDRKASEVRGLATRLAWLVDGWLPLVDMWFDAKEDTAQLDALAYIVPRLPFIPAKEVNRDQSEKATSMFGRGRRLVRLNEDWKTGEPDPELVMRFEAMKAKEMQA